MLLLPSVVANFLPYISSIFSDNTHYPVNLKVFQKGILVPYVQGVGKLWISPVSIQNRGCWDTSWCHVSIKISIWLILERKIDAQTIATGCNKGSNVSRSITMYLHAMSILMYSWKCHICSQYLDTRPWLVNYTSRQIDFQCTCPDGQLKTWDKTMVVKTNDGVYVIWAS